MFGEIEVLFDRFTKLSTNLKSSFKTSSKFIYRLTHKKGQNSLLNTKVQVQSAYHVTSPFISYFFQYYFFLKSK